MTGTAGFRGDIGRVSVVIPTYNRAGYIRQAVQSVFDQTYPHHEVIVVDDGSTDGTPQALEPYRDRVRYLYQDNQGPGGARNRGLLRAEGEFIVFLDADDYLLPGKLAEQLACFAVHPSLGAVHSGWRLVGEQGEFLREVEPWHEAPRLDLETWVWRRPAHLGAMLIRRTWLDRVGPFDPQLRQAEDVDLLLRLALLGCKMVWLRKPTVCFRQHGGNLTRDGKAQAMYAGMALNKFFVQSGIPRRIRQLEGRIRYYTLLWSLWCLFRSGNGDDIAHGLQQALTWSPHPTGLAVFDWAGQFAGWATEEGFNVHEIWDLLPHIRAAVGDDVELCMHAESAVHWWAEVWWPCLAHDWEQAAQGLAAYHRSGLLDWMAQAEHSLLVGPSSGSAELVRRFWDLVTAQGLVSPGQRHQVVRLYLLVGGRLLGRQRWDAAGRAIAAALRGSWHLRTALASFHSLRAILSAPTLYAGGK